MSEGNGRTRTPDEIRAEIDRARAQIATSVVELKQQVALTILGRRDETHLGADEVVEHQVADERRPLGRVRRAQ